MSCLAHIFCSNDTPASMLGSFLADLVKGDAEGRYLPPINEQQIARGI